MKTPVMRIDAKMNQDFSRCMLKFLFQSIRVSQTEGPIKNCFQ